MNFVTKLKNEVIDILKNVDLLKDEDIENSFETPPEPEFGDLAVNICFSLAKKLRKSPHEISKDIIAKIKIPKDSLIKKVEIKNCYINFFFNYEKLSKLVLKNILKEKENYGSSNIGKNKGIMIEFCHVNTHKGLHIGHFRNMCIGDSLSRTLEFSGYKVYRVNYQGDIGPHVALCLWGFINLYNCKGPKENKGEWLGNVYAEANGKVESNEALQQEVREINKKLYEGDKEILKYWKMTRKWSLDYFDGIYKELGIKFDKLYFESQVEGRATEIAKELLKKGLATLSEGAIIIDLTKYNLGIFVLLTKDGTPLYSAKDLSLAEQQFSDFKIDKCIHVVGSEQKMYFQQLFKTFELINSPGAGRSEHLSYELVMLKTGKMSSRSGNVILYTELRDQVLNKTLKEVEAGNMKITKKEKIAKMIALGAMKYGMLNVGHDKVIIFDWEEALKLEGNTGPYLQYAHTRCNGILEKAKKWKENFDNKNVTKEEKNLIKKLVEFPAIVEQTSKDYKTNNLCNYAYELATVFNEFYHACPVLRAETKDIRNFRLTLVKATKITLKNCLKLLGIDAPEKM